jgi:hypothetical protein
MLDRERHRIRIEDDEGEVGEMYDPSAKHHERSRSLTAAELARLEAELAAVRAGGPFSEEDMRRDGGCSLTLTSGGAESPFFVIAKDRVTTRDAVSDLVRDLAAADLP